MSRHRPGRWHSPGGRRGFRAILAALRTVAAPALLLTALAAACSPGGPGTPTDRPETVHETTVSMPVGEPLPVALLDRTGLVTSIAGVEPVVGDGEDDGDGITALDGHELLFWDWLGGSCDTGTFLTFEETETGYRLLTRTDTSGDICDLAGVPHRLEIHVSSPVDPATVVVVPGQ